MHALLSGEVPDDCALLDIAGLVGVLSQDNELIVADVKVEDLVIDEELGKQSEVLTVEFVVFAVN